MKRARPQNIPLLRDAAGEPFTVRFQDWDCHVVLQAYESPWTPCLRLVDATDGSPIARATANLAGVGLAPDEVPVRDYSENEGLFGILVRAGLVQDTGRTVESGHARLNVARLNPVIAEQWKQLCDRLLAEPPERTR